MAKTTSSGRIVALDAFRGAVVLLMLLVNNVALDAATPAMLRHGAVGEVRLADLVFPGFLFAAGVALPLSRRRSGWMRAVGRALALIALGWVADSAAYGRLTIGLGVLQIIGLAGLVAGAVQGLAAPWRLVVAVVLLAEHTLFLMRFPVPEVARGTVAESANAIAYVNRTLLSAWHLSGLLSVVPTAALVLLGTVVGERLRAPDPHRLRHFLGDLLLGGAFFGAGIVLSALVPPSKSLWTASFILISGGLGTLALGLLFALERVGIAWLLTPFAAAGANAILAYVAPIVFKRVALLTAWQGKPPLDTFWKGELYEHFGRIAGGWIWTIGFVACWWLALGLLYRRRIFLRV